MESLGLTGLLHISLIFIGFAGFFLAFNIWSKKQEKKPLVCPMKSDCNTVVHSRFSVFAGIPLEVIGMLYYTFVIFTHVLFLFFGVHSDWLVFITLFASATAFLFSLYLTSIQAFVLKQWCVWCLTSAFFCFIIFATTALTIDFNLKEFLFDHKKLFTVFHLMFAAVGVGAATVTDIFFFKFLRDLKISEFEDDVMKTISHIIWVALGGLIITGLALYLPETEYLNSSGKFLVKAVAVGVLVLNGFLLNIVVASKLVNISFGANHEHKVGELHVLRKLSYSFGAISITSWYFIFVLGALRRVAVPFVPLLVGYILLLLVAIIISQFVERHYSKKVIQPH
ncbi:MAG: vitamin K epoxide reductase family protein [Candidatus Pacebacteria bacterium]|jgi:uncharacterized membrane protein|nr:vitamin K epoxide reductase family protein [Candidatus Paceibacterota bacterium]MBP9058488.1 vitamin K epoxide reductase family protein [Candidatus Paceibacterota bacterium]MBP9770465.1 vitamin K epoxide reductase family protein [Candidatus Paceibacterota bacterium]